MKPVSLLTLLEILQARLQPWVLDDLAAHAIVWKLHWHYFSHVQLDALCAQTPPFWPRWPLGDMHIPSSFHCPHFEGRGLGCSFLCPQILAQSGSEERLNACPWCQQISGTGYSFHTSPHPGCFPEPFSSLSVFF